MHNNSDCRSYKLQGRYHDATFASELSFCCSKSTLYCHPMFHKCRKPIKRFERLAWTDSQSRDNSEHNFGPQEDFRITRNSLVGSQVHFVRPETVLRPISGPCGRTGFRPLAFRTSCSHGYTHQRTDAKKDWVGRVNLCRGSKENSKN